MSYLDGYLRVIPFPVTGHDSPPPDVGSLTANTVRELSLRVLRLEAALDELFQEPGNAFLGYEMARGRLRSPLP